MSEESRKRSSIRHSYETAIMFTCRPDHPYCYYGARMFNHSTGGIYFESLYPLEPGDIVYFNRASESLDDSVPDTYKPHCVRVKWCREVEESAEACYGIGVQFVDPAACREMSSGADPLQLACDEPAAEPPGRDTDLFDAVDVGHEPILPEAKFRTAMELAESRAKKLSVLNRFATSVGSTLDLDEILQSVCQEMTEIFGARNTGIGLLNRKRTQLTLVAFHAVDAEESDATGLVMPLEGNAATHRVVETGQAIVVPDVQHNPLTGSIHDIAKARGTECLMIVPLLTRGEVIGTIGMPTSDKDRVFSTEDVALAQTIANQIASAIENARLFEKTEKAREIAEQDLEIGRKIQTEFFPAEIPDVTGWEIAAHFQPARKVSGDFYDLFPVGTGHCYGLVIADVCDHGVGSALFMVLFRSLIRAYAEPSFQICKEKASMTPENVAAALVETVRRTNTYIATTHESSGMFATLFFGVLDPESGWLHYANCGHEPPVLLDAAGIAGQLNPTGPAVGLDADLVFSSEGVRIEAGQTLLCFTDGTTDAQNEEGEYFSKKRLMKLLDQPVHAAGELIGRIEAGLEVHIAGADLYDDVTLLAVRNIQHEVSA